MRNRFPCLLAAAVLAVAALVSSQSGATAQSDNVFTTVTPQKQYVVVAPGPREAASAGSYALRVYGARNAHFPTDDFVTGIVRPRDGSVARITWRDIFGNGSKELVVVCVSAGSGGYLSADALTIAGGRIVLVASVKGLNPKADVVKALRTAAHR